MSPRSGTSTLALVVRVSRVGKRAGERFQSPGDQVAIATARAERDGYATRVFDADAENGGVSGATAFADRPGMGAAMAAVERGELAGFVVSALDRLVREDAERGVTLTGFQRWCREQGAVLLVADNAAAEVVPGVDELEGNEEWGVAGANLANAIYRREMKKRWRRAKHNAWERGVFVGPSPAGYAADEDGRLHVNGHHKDVARAFALRGEGGSYASVARYLTERGVPSAGSQRSVGASDGTWRVPAVRSVLRNPVYKGLHRCSCGCGAEAYREELDLVGERAWDAVQPGKNGRRGRGPGSGTSLLSGLLRCAGCGFLMQAGSTAGAGRKTYRFYRCPNTACTEKAAVSAEVAEAYLVEEAVRRFDGWVQGPEVALGPYERAVDAAERELADLEVGLRRGTVSASTAVRLAGALESRLEEATAALEEAQAAGSGTFFADSTVREVLLGEADAQRRRAALRELLPGGAVVRRGRMSADEKIAVAA